MRIWVGLATPRQRSANIGGGNMMLIRANAQNPLRHSRGCLDIRFTMKRGSQRTLRESSRPTPPHTLLLAREPFGPRFVPAPELLEWVNVHILNADGQLYNPDHGHLQDADLTFLWAASGFAKAGRTVLGQAEQIMIRAGGWQKARQEDQFIAWFGRIPAFLITLAADYCADCSDVEFCALVEHELYHVGHARDEYGAPAFYKDGRPKLAIRGHDVEEFTGVVRRYGPTPDVQRIVDAAKVRPEVSRLNLAHACGCCLKAA